MFKGCQFLLGFHLSDNDITKCKYDAQINDFDYEETFYECTADFGISEADLIAINRSKRSRFGQPWKHKENIISSHAGINYEEYLKTYFN